MSNKASESIGGYVAMPAVVTGFGALSSMKTYKGVKNAFKAQNHQGFRAIKDALDADTFTASRKLAFAYEQYKPLAKTQAKLAKKTAKIAKTGKLPLKDRFFNLFKSQDKKTTIESVQDAFETANKNLKNADDAINAVKNAKNTKEALSHVDDVLQTSTKLADVAKTSTKAVKVGLKAQAIGFKNCVVKNFKNEFKLKNGAWLNYLFTAIEFVPRIFKKVIPTFKNEGFGAGMKSLGKTIIQAGTDLVGYAAGGALGRAIGSAIGTLICPGVGSAVGGTIGDMLLTTIIGSKAVKTVDNLLGENKENQEQENNTQINQTQPQQQIKQARHIQQINQTQPQQAQKQRFAIDEQEQALVLNKDYYNNQTIPNPRLVQNKSSQLRNYYA